MKAWQQHRPRALIFAQHEARAVRDNFFHLSIIRFLATKVWLINHFLPEALRHLTPFSGFKLQFSFNLLFQIQDLKGERSFDKKKFMARLSERI